MILTKEHIKEIEITENAVCAFFEVDKKDVYDKITRHRESQARAFIFYILHVDMGISVGCICKRYKRERDSVFKSVAKMKYMIEKMHAYKEMYLGICNERKMVLTL